MARTIITAVFIVAMCSNVFGQDSKPSSSCAALCPQAAEIVAELLDIRLSALPNPHTSDAGRRFAEHLHSLFEDQDPAADQAVAALLSFYLGEANDHDLMCSITRRGKRILPDLQRFQANPPCAQNGNYGSLLHEEDLRLDHYSLGIEAIQNGELVACD